MHTEELPTGTRSDSGPDSGDNDNYRWRAPRRRFRLRALRPDRAEERPDRTRRRVLVGRWCRRHRTRRPWPGAGHDRLAPPPHRHRRRARLRRHGHRRRSGCPRRRPGPWRERSGTSEQCEPIPYLLRTGNEGEAQLVELLKDLGNQAALQPTFTLKTVWEPEPASYPVSRVTQIDYGDGPQPIQWCGGTPGAPTLPAGQLWCLSGQSSEPAGDDLIVVTERFYGAGDPRFLR